MITLLPPAKSLNMNVRHNLQACTQPLFNKQAQEIMRVLKMMSEQEIMDVMKVSEAIAQLNHGRFASFSQKHTQKNAAPALFAYNGDTHKQLQRNDYGDAQLSYAQKYVYFVSALYGLLRPLDCIQAYRLEMARKVSVGDAKNLYDYWEDVFADYLNKQAKKLAATVILNACSKEYAKAINAKKITIPVVTVEFRERKNDTFNVIGIYSKKARGLLGNYVIKNQITNIEKVKDFTGDRYAFSEKDSTDTLFVFLES